MEPAERERGLVRAVRKLVPDDVGDDPRGWELGLQIGEVLPLVRGEAGDVDEADDVLGDAGGGDYRSAVGVPDEQNGPVDLADDALEVPAVAAGQSSQRVRRSDDRQVLADKLVVQCTKAGYIGERAVHENDGGVGLSH